MQKKNPFTSGHYPKNSQRVKSLIFYITLKSDHIREIVTCFLAMGIKEPEQDENKNNTGIAAKVFENSDFGYYKVAIERPRNSWR